jgi:hypothetical protein
MHQQQQQQQLRRHAHVSSGATTACFVVMSTAAQGQITSMARSSIFHVAAPHRVKAIHASSLCSRLNDRTTDQK